MRDAPSASFPLRPHRAGLAQPYAFSGCKSRVIPSPSFLVTKLRLAVGILIAVAALSIAAVFVNDRHPAPYVSHIHARDRAGLGRRSGAYRQSRLAVERGPDVASHAPVIAPLLCNGPSNQIYAAKLALWTMRGDTTGATLVLPPILPHFTQRRSKDKPVPFSTFFEVGDPARTEMSRFSALVEEQELWKGTAPCRVAAAAAATVNKTCPVFVGDLARLDRCKTYASWWADRAAGRACTGGFTFPTYAGGLAALAAELATGVGPAADAARGDHRSPPGLVLTCYLEQFLNPAILFAATDIADSDGGGYALQNTKLAGKLPEHDQAAAGAAWIDAASVLKFRGVVQSAPRPVARATKASARPLSLALQMRVPDFDAIATNRSSKPDAYCLGGTRKCDQSKNLRLPRSALLKLIADAVDGTHPWLVEHAKLEALGSITHVHVLTNDQILRADVTKFLQGRGLHVTSSPNRSLFSLMEDYAAAVNADVFWGMRSSSISANIVHARLAAKRPARSTVFWEDLAPKNRQHAA